MAETWEKTVRDGFVAVFKIANVGPAADYLTGKDVSDAGLKLALDKTEHVLINRRGLNPYRANIQKEMENADWFAEHTWDELEATRDLLDMITKMRQAVVVPAPKIANSVEKPVIVKMEDFVNAGEEVEKKSKEA